MTELPQELMTPDEAARWFRRSVSWLRHQSDLQRFGQPGGQPLYHVNVCRAYVLGRLCGLVGEQLRRVQIEALAAACGISDPRLLGEIAGNARCGTVVRPMKPQDPARGEGLRRRASPTSR